MHIVKRKLANGEIKTYRYLRHKRNGETIKRYDYRYWGDEKSNQSTLAQLMAKVDRIMPGTTGIYFLICEGDIVYVGQSKDVLARLGQHATAGVRFDDYRFIECDPIALDALEFHYIKRFAPKFNHEPGSRIRRERNGERLVKETEAEEVPAISMT